MPIYTPKHRAPMDRVEVHRNDIHALMDNDSAHREEGTRFFLGLVPDPMPPKVAALVEGILDK